MKGQDIVVLAKLCDPEARSMGYAELGVSLALSASEVHAAVRRLCECGLLNGKRIPLQRNMMEFLFSGLRYVFPFRAMGTIVRESPRHGPPPWLRVHSRPMAPLRFGRVRMAM